MAVMVAPMYVEQRACPDCPRTRTHAVEMVATERRVVAGVLQVSICRRVTVLDGCPSCDGSTTVL